MAYKAAIDERCYWSGCSKPAKWRVFNNCNGEIGQFCIVHACRKVDELQMAERKVQKPTENQ